MWTPVVAGLAAAIFMAWFARPVFAPQSLSLTDVLLAATMYILAVFVASAATAFLVAPSRGNFRKVTLRTAAAVMWVAPLFLFFWYQSLWAAGASVGLAGSVAGLWDTGEAGDRTDRRFVTALCASAILQLAMVAAMGNYSRGAALLAGIGVALLVWVRPEPRAARFTLPRALPRIALAILLTAVNFARFLKFQGGPGGLGGPGGAAEAALLEALMAGEAAIHSSAAKKTKEQQAEMVGGGDFSGVILYPELTPHVMLIPPLPTAGHGLIRGNRAKPLSIPFFGVYYFFRPPYRRPPPNSHTARGSTMKTVYRSVDRTRLYMEAQQNFGVFMDVNCCRRIDLVIRNADPAPEKVWLELSLMDTTLAGGPPLALGKATVTADAEQTLSFTMPTNPPLRRFDKATIGFHISDRSVKIAIERFVLVP